MSTDIAKQLGYKEGVTAFFLRAPQEYWQLLGTRQAPYDDNSGEYEFIHAFFSSADELSDFADILASKLSHDGLLWISLPNVSDNADIDDITATTVDEIMANLGLEAAGDMQLNSDWNARKYIWSTKP